MISVSLHFSDFTNIAIIAWPLFFVLKISWHGKHWKAKPLTLPITYGDKFQMCCHVYIHDSWSSNHRFSTSCLPGSHYSLQYGFESEDEKTQEGARVRLRLLAKWNKCKHPFTWDEGGDGTATYELLLNILPVDDEGRWYACWLLKV